MPSVDELTPEQAVQISACRDKWSAIALRTDRIDRPAATAAIQATYEIIHRPPPEIIFCDSPYAAAQTLSQLLHTTDSLGKRLAFKLDKQFHDRLFHWFKKQLSVKVFDLVSQHLSPSLSLRFSTTIDSQLERQLGSSNFYLLLEELTNHFMPECHIFASCEFDFFISVLGCTYDPPMWELNQALIENCGWIYPYDRLAIVCDRPTTLLLDEEGCLHAIEQPAIVFADGFSAYAHHGEVVPV